MMLKRGISGKVRKRKSGSRLLQVDMENSNQNRQVEVVSDLMLPSLSALGFENLCQHVQEQASSSSSPQDCSYSKSFQDFLEKKVD